MRGDNGTSELASNQFFLDTGAKACLIPSPKHLWESDRSKRSKDILKEMGCRPFVNGLNNNVEVTITDNQIMILPEIGEQMVIRKNKISNQALELIG